MHKTHAFRVVGLSLLTALGLTVLVAAFDQPEASAGVFKVSGKPIPSGLGVKVEGLPEGQTAFVIANLNVEFVCAKFVTLEGELAPEGVGALKLLYKECVMWFIEGSKSEHKLIEVLPCEVKDVVLEASLLVVLSEGSTYLLAEGRKNAKGETVPLLTIEKKGEEFACPFGSVMTFRGTEAFEMPVGDLQKGPEAEAVLIRPAGPEPQALLKDKFVFGTQLTTMEGSMKLFLGGAHTGLAWGAI